MKKMNAIVDQLGRPIRDLRISVTDRCNFRCTYCMPKEVFGDDFVFLAKNELLSFEELERLARIFAQLGVKKLRLTGGEPLMRRNLPELIQKLHDIEGIEDIGLTTNAVLLGQYAQPLYDAGLRRLNISLDALDPELFGQINGRGISPDLVLKNIQKAQDIGFTIKVNMVVQKGVNEIEILPMATYFKERGITLRYIEFMDVGNDNGWSFKKVVTKKEIYDMLAAEFDMEPAEEDYYGEVAKRYRYIGTEAQVGFITSVSESFCSTCTRSRLSSEGKLYTCLFASEGFDLRELIRSDKTDEELYEVIADVWRGRKDRYSDERTEQTVKNRKKINMNYIGG
ncbi:MULTISPECIES: GTP 3',8-cyclase MoaA [unclassified Sporosarcina]|uniref:GTP 3',8-cyclase MoaA n=1 Tax=unclassified Sporosarcina TaxID=2647733 RepID=UPI000C166F7C|nr:MULTISPECIES: GTP 3',8-cyclase MoaA [unclassified Sporosarcina]PID04804.1 GTP 3',8-cyclase MoaA [Sporosarcina sp. P30]PID07959.1 GTP 3',8-cyclase MoaA [Sporosarcina sp. P31]PID11145.1 GTP 3',8-cyclase MoaA [Sporosarcina sp. P32b]